MPTRVMLLGALVAKKSTPSRSRMLMTLDTCGALVFVELKAGRERYLPHRQDDLGTADRAVVPGAPAR